MRVIALPLVLAALTGTLFVGAPAPIRDHSSASSPDTVVAHVSGGAIDSAFRSLAASRSSADIARDLPTGDLTRYQFVALSRRVAGPAELHERWSDIVVVRAGAAVLRTGGALTNQRTPGQGERSGDAISGGRDRSVGPGDMVVIPAGLPHQWRPLGNAPFSYVVLKVHPGQVSASAAHGP